MVSTDTEELGGLPSAPSRPGSRWQWKPLAAWPISLYGAETFRQTYGHHPEAPQSQHTPVLGDNGVAGMLDGARIQFQPL